MTIPLEKVNEFLNSVLALASIDFPAVARTVGLEWPALKSELISNETYNQAFDNAMEEIRYKLLDKILLTGRDGKKGMGKDPELSYLRAVIQMIDDGLLVRREKAAPTPPAEPDPEVVAEHRRRLGLNIEDKKP